MYDTQCGAKLFEKNLARDVFSEKFLSSWCFDVEILARIIQLYDRKTLLKTVREIHLKMWEDKNNSKLKWYSSIKMALDLMRIKMFYDKS